MSKPTPELIITRGYAGSGKTTIALQWIAGDSEHRVRVNRDDLRLAMYGRYSRLSFNQEQAVTVAQHAAVRALLSAGKSVIVDDTNLKLKNARGYADLAAELGVPFGVRDIDTDVETCILNDRARKNSGGRGVGQKVIRDMAARYAQPWPEVTPTTKKPGDRGWRPEPYDRADGLPQCWVVDIDGTLAHNDGHRGWYDWDKVGDDTPVEDVIRLVTALYDASYPIIVMSGRDEEARAATEEWLAQLPFKYEALYMRPTSDGVDQVGDEIVKSRLFDQHVRGRWNVIGVVDDRPRVCRMWRTMGLTVAQVGDPHVEF